MLGTCQRPRRYLVALLTEGVDRNFVHDGGQTSKWRSPSSRRAWIEIMLCCTPVCTLAVALLTEGVDRNFFVLRCTFVVLRRPPHGGRG